MLTVSLDALRLTPGARVLDLGSGEGRHLHALSVLPGVTAVGLDLSEADLLKSRESWRGLFPDAPLNVACGNAGRLPFPDNAFDAVVCSEVLEHLHDWRAAAAEIARVVKPGGRIALSVPRFWPEAVCWKLSKGYPNTPGGHVRIFRKAQLTGEAEALGWCFLRSHYAHGLHAPYWWLQCLVWERRENHRAVAAYRRFLEWDILEQPRLTRWLDAALNPIMGKSLALYFEAPE